MSRAQQFLNPLFGRGLLPYSIDFSTKSDGALPGPWAGATWVVSGGLALNTPTLGAELLTDPGLEANYTAGLCDTLTKGGSPAVADGAPDVHGGSHAQQFAAAAISNYVAFPNVSGVVGQWYQMSVWRKQTVGTSYSTRSRFSQTGALPAVANDIGLISSSWAQDMLNAISTTTNPISCQVLVELSGTPTNTVIVDDCSLKSAADLCAMLPVTQTDVIIKLRTPGLWAAWTDSTVLGIILRGSDTGSLPTNCIIALVRRRASGPNSGVATLIKKIGTTYTSVIAETTVTLVANGDLEVRASGTTISLWYNDAQVGGDQTIADAELVNNKYHGMLSGGGNGASRFFVQAS